MQGVASGRMIAFTADAYYGQYTYQQPPQGNGTASAWDRLRKKSPSS